MGDCLPKLTVHRAEPEPEKTRTPDEERQEELKRMERKMLKEFHRLYPRPWRGSLTPVNEGPCPLQRHRQFGPIA
jgi:hypothetical protein